MGWALDFAQWVWVPSVEWLVENYPDSCTVSGSQIFWFRSLNSKLPWQKSQGFVCALLRRCGACDLAWQGGSEIEWGRTSCALQTSTFAGLAIRGFSWMALGGSVLLYGGILGLCTEAETRIELCLFVLRSSQPAIQWCFGFWHPCLPNAIVFRLCVTFLHHYIALGLDFPNIAMLDKYFLIIAHT